MSLDTARAARKQGSKVQQLLDEQEQLAMARITNSVQQLGEELCSATEARRRIRAHPWIATSIAAGLGFCAGPAALRASAQRLSSPTGFALPGPLRALALPAVLAHALSLLRGRKTD